MLVALVGIDGAGKTTQARRLAVALRARGMRARYAEHGGGRPVIDPLARLLGRRDGPDLLGPAHIPVEAGLRWLAVARSAALARVTRGVVVMDRAGVCQLATMRARRDGSADAAVERRVRAAFARLPRPDVVCLLTLPPAVAQERVERRGRDREELARLEAFDRAYRSLPEASSFVRVDASGDEDAVHAALLRVVLPVVARGDR